MPYSSFANKLNWFPLRKPFNLSVTHFPGTNHFLLLMELLGDRKDVINKQSL